MCPSHPAGTGSGWDGDPVNVQARSARPDGRPAEFRVLASQDRARLANLRERAAQAAQPASWPEAGPAASDIGPGVDDPHPAERGAGLVNPGGATCRTKPKAREPRRRHGAMRAHIVPLGGRPPASRVFPAAPGAWSVAVRAGRVEPLSPVGQAARESCSARRAVRQGWQRQLTASSKHP